MGYQGNFIAHLPGHLLYLTSAIFLVLVSFNTPLLKSFYFLKATYSQGANAGDVSFGTLGYCFNRSGGEVCTGPQVGYEIGEFEAHDCVSLRRACVRVLRSMPGG
jgi:hypothetical protein